MDGDFSSVSSSVSSDGEASEDNAIRARDGLLQQWYPLSTSYYPVSPPPSSYSSLLSSQETMSSATTTIRRPNPSCPGGTTPKQIPKMTASSISWTRYSRTYRHLRALNIGTQWIYCKMLVLCHPISLSAYLYVRVSYPILCIINITYDHIYIIFNLNSIFYNSNNSI